RPGADMEFACRQAFDAGRQLECLLVVLQPLPGQQTCLSRGKGSTVRDTRHPRRWRNGQTCRAKSAVEREAVNSLISPQDHGECAEKLCGLLWREERAGRFQF